MIDCGLNNRIHKNLICIIPNVLVLKGCIVTIDTMGCQQKIAARIIEKGADYLLAVKGNQACLEEGTEQTIRFASPVSEWTDDDFGHGCIEQRKCRLYHDLSFIDHAQAWKNLTAIVKIEATRYITSGGKEEKEVRLYITSSKENAKVMAHR